MELLLTKIIKHKKQIHVYKKQIFSCYDVIGKSILSNGLKCILNMS